MTRHSHGEFEPAFASCPSESVECCRWMSAQYFHWRAARCCAWRTDPTRKTRSPATRRTHAQPPDGAVFAPECGTLDSRQFSVLRVARAATVPRGPDEIPACDRTRTH